ncbi:helix-turn-helix domain-containing protein [Actinokineospora diospyrosa]|uniref:helix-turn-helix domain-containing protein n=1 Tax=Actinokineospora diospyrosa TaxID=103728 RepID=UPI0020A2A8E3|nr:helix-turn-helix transcriptional regulator [Actinokineospora diospyrosa]
MNKHEPTIRARELGESMRVAMVRANLNGVRTCAQLGWSKSKLSRMFLGTRGISSVDLADFLQVCGVTGDERDRMLAICDELRAPTWTRVHGDQLPRHLHTLIDHEAQAVAIRGLDVLVVPAPLQTDDYARALVAADVTVPAGERDARVVAKLTRRQFVKRDAAPRCVFHIHESALRLPVCGPDVLVDQARDLVRTCDRPNVTIRVVPAERGVSAVAAGSFRLLEFADYKPVVCVETETSCQFVAGEDEVDAYRTVLASLADRALSPGESRAFLAALAQEPAC